MRFQVLQAIRQIDTQWPAEAAKILEKLLAISFDPKRGGFQVESKTTQGVDICLVGGDKKFSIEVKTTAGPTITLEEKDVTGLAEKFHNDWYSPCVAALRIDLLEDWVIADATRLIPDAYTPTRLSLDSIPDLESIARIQFERTLLELLETILSPINGSPLELLTEVLKSESA